MTEVGYEGKHEPRTPNNGILHPSSVLSRPRDHCLFLRASSPHPRGINEMAPRVSSKASWRGPWQCVCVCVCVCVCASAVYILLMVCSTPTLILEPSKCPHIQMNTSYSHLAVCFLHSILRNSLWCFLMDRIPFHIVQITYWALRGSEASHQQT